MIDTRTTTTTKSTITGSSPSCSSANSSIIRRVQQLELSVGLYDGINVSTSSTTPETSVSSKIPSNVDVEERIHLLEQKYQVISKNRREDYDAIDMLLLDLSPGTALTNQKQIMAPILYRKQEIIASSDTYQRNIYHTQQILHLLSIGQTMLSSSSSSSSTSYKITDEQVVNAPIIVQQHETSNTQQPTDDEINQLSATIIQLQQQIENISYSIDTMIDHYTNLITAVSEKMILMDEKVTIHINSNKD